MTIKELIEKLLKYPHHTEILLSSDGEGNTISRFGSMGLTQTVEADYILLYPSDETVDIDEVVIA